MRRAWADAIDERVDQEALLRVLFEIATPHELALFLRSCIGYNSVEVADDYGISDSNVRNRMLRLRRKVAREVAW